jgi:hypothetical protein
MLGLTSIELAFLGNLRSNWVVVIGLELLSHLGHMHYVEPHKLECPLGNPSSGESNPDDFSETKRGYHTDGVTLKIMQELVLHN